MNNSYTNPKGDFQPGALSVTWVIDHNHQFDRATAKTKLQEFHQDRVADAVVIHVSTGFFFTIVVEIRSNETGFAQSSEQMVGLFHQTSI